MLGRGLRSTISSFSSVCRSAIERRTLRRDSVSRVSSSRETESGFPVRFGLARFMDLGTVVCGRRALVKCGDVLIGSSSGVGEGEAFRFLEPEGVDTTRTVNNWYSSSKSFSQHTLSRWREAAMLVEMRRDGWCGQAAHVGWRSNLLMYETRSNGERAGRFEIDSTVYRHPTESVSEETSNEGIVSDK